MNNLFCAKCNSIYGIDEIRWRCDCGAPLDIHLKPTLNLPDLANRPYNMWRYRESLPLNDHDHIVSFNEGFSPLLEVSINGRSVWIKQDHLFPTGSFKDRGATLLISKVKELGIEEVVIDSSGNAAAAVAAYCARGGINCKVFVPESTTSAKVGQIQMYGATVTRVPGTREDTAAAVLKEAESTYYASHYWNPFFLHGTKTFAYEVCEQLHWQAPDSIVLPVGNGSLLLGVAIGFAELIRIGAVEEMPRLIAIQAEDCAPLYRAFQTGSEVIPATGKPGNLAEGIAIADPLRGNQIVDVVEKSHGDFLKVNNGEIRQSIQEMAARGFYIEPTSAAAIAGIKKYLNSASEDEKIVSVFTGHGLKAASKISMLFHD